DAQAIETGFLVDPAGGRTCLQTNLAHEGPFGTGVSKRGRAVDLEQRERAGIELEFAAADAEDAAEAFHAGGRQLQRGCRLPAVRRIEAVGDGGGERVSRAERIERADPGFGAIAANRI